jgi:hypothetical protein
MHRSGTSALTRVLNLLGCQTPRTLMPAHEFNPRGHWESESIRQFNDELLHAVGSGWSDWTPVSPGFGKSPTYAAYQERAVELLRTEFNGSRLVVFKDPRICRLGEFWMDALESADFEPAVILPVRNPLEVAASLGRRDGIEESYVQLLWLRHVLDAEASTRGHRRIFTTFEDLLEGWEALVARIGAGLDIAWPRFSELVAGEITSSLDVALKHHAKPSRAVIANPGLSAWLRDTYALLESWAKNGENAGDYAALDNIRVQLDASAPAFGKVILSGENARSRVLALEGRIAELEQAGQQIRVLEQQVEALKEDGNIHQALDEERQRNHALGGELDSLQNRLADQDSALRQKQEEAAQAWAEADAGRESAAALIARNDHLEHRVEALLRSLADSERWVFELAEERQRETRRADGFKNEVRWLTQAMNGLKAEAARLTDALAAEKLARKDARAAAEDEAERLRNALTAQETANSARTNQMERDLVEAQAARRLAEDRVLHAEALKGDLDHRLAERFGELAEMAKLLRESDQVLVAGKTELSQAKAQLESRFGEIAQLTRLYREQEYQAKAQRGQVDWLRRVHSVMQQTPRWWAIMPASWQTERQLRRLQRKRLFDGNAYLARYPDVAAEGIAPLHHYIVHGMGEGRSIQASEHLHDGH